MNIILNDYEVANLRVVLEAISKTGSLLNNGDWVLQIYNKLPKVEHLPNHNVEELMDCFAPLV